MSPFWKTSPNYTSFLHFFWPVNMTVTLHSFLYKIQYYPLGCMASIVACYSRDFVFVVRFYEICLWGQQNQSCGVVSAVRGCTTVSYDSQAELKSVMPRTGQLALCLRQNCDWISIHESLKDLTNPGGPMAKDGEVKLLNRLQLFCCCRLKANANNPFTLIFNVEFLSLSCRESMKKQQCAV